MIIGPTQNKTNKLSIKEFKKILTGVEIKNDLMGTGFFLGVTNISWNQTLH